MLGRGTGRGGCRPAFHSTIAPPCIQQDGTSVQARSIGEQIEADHYPAGKRAAAAARPALGQRFTGFRDQTPAGTREHIF